jgi:hypothetical protein
MAVPNDTVWAPTEYPNEYNSLSLEKKAAVDNAVKIVKATEAAADAGQIDGQHAVNVAGHPNAKIHYRISAKPPTNTGPDGQRRFMVTFISEI